MDDLIGRARDRWEVAQPDNGEIHVYPVDVNGENHERHTLVGMGCWCRPQRDDEVPKLIVHNETN